MSPTPHSPRNALGSGLVWVSPASAFVTSSCCGGLPSNRGGRKRHRYPRSAQCGDVLSTLVQYEIAYEILLYIYIPRSQRSCFFKGLFQNTGSWVELQVLYRILGVNPVFHKRAVFWVLPISSNFHRMIIDDLKMFWSIYIFNSGVYRDKSGLVLSKRILLPKHCHAATEQPAA